MLDVAKMESHGKKSRPRGIFFVVGILHQKKMTSQVAFVIVMMSFRHRSKRHHFLSKYLDDMWS